MDGDKEPDSGQVFVIGVEVLVDVSDPRQVAEVAGRIGELTGVLVEAAGHKSVRFHSGWVDVANGQD